MKNTKANSKCYIGKTRGSFTVYSISEKKVPGSKLYLNVRCLCGKTKEIRTDAFIKLKEFDQCVCDKGSPLRIDITNQRFGLLTAIERVKSPSVLSHNHWRCVCDCGKECFVGTGTLRSNKQKSCGCFSGNRVGNGRVGHDLKTKDGYILKYLPSHPARKRNYVFEHRIVMESVIGRYLLKEETVHHKNGVKDDNRPENLELWASNHSSGQRVSDMIEHAINILKTYKPELLKL